MVDLKDPVQPLATPSRTAAEPAAPLDATPGPTVRRRSLDIRDPVHATSARDAVGRLPRSAR
jgi:hypothetical protein